MTERGDRPVDYVEVPHPRNGLGVAALVIGIVGLLLSVLPGIHFLGFLVDPAAILLGIVAVRRVRRGTATARGPGMAGIVLGVLALVAATLWTVGFVYAARLGTECRHEGRTTSDTQFRECVQDKLRERLSR